MNPIQNYLLRAKKPVPVFLQLIWNQYSFALLTTDFFKIGFDANKYKIIIDINQYKYLIVF